MDARLRNLGQRIKDLRKARGWSQEKFADVCGVHRTYMGHLERGEKNVSFNTLVRLAEALEITVSELVSDERRPSGSGTRRRGKSQAKAISGDDIGGIVHELNSRRTTLEETARVLRDMAEALRRREQSGFKRHED